MMIRIEAIKETAVKERDAIAFQSVAYISCLAGARKTITVDRITHGKMKLDHESKIFLFKG